MNPIATRQSGLRLVGATALLLASATAQATVFDDAWSCAKSVGQGVYLQATVGAKALGFIASLDGAQCVVKFSSTPDLVGMGVVIGVSNAGILPKTQPYCEDRIYDTVASPIASGLTLIPILPQPAKDTLYGIAKGEIKGALLKNVPGAGFVGGSLSCGCGLTDAGLSVDTVKKVANTIDNIGNACGGPVWDAAKKVLKGVVGVLKNPGDSVIDGINNLGDWLGGQNKHMPVDVYFATHYYYDVVPMAGALSAFREFTPKKKTWYTQYETGDYYWPDMQPELWGSVDNSREGCAAYFDGHTMSLDKAQRACNDMIDGTGFSDPMFYRNGVKQRVRKLLFEYAVVEAVRLRSVQQAKAFANSLKLELPPDVPPGIGAGPIAEATYAFYGSDTAGKSFYYSMDHRNGAQFPFDSIGDRAAKAWEKVQGDAFAPFDPNQVGAQARVQAQQAMQIAEASFGNVGAEIRAQAQANSAGAVAYYRKVNTPIVIEGKKPQSERCGNIDKAQCVAEVNEAEKNCDYQLAEYRRLHPEYNAVDGYMAIKAGYQQIQAACDKQIGALIRASLFATMDGARDFAGFTLAGPKLAGNAGLLAQLERRNSLGRVPALRFSVKPEALRTRLGPNAMQGLQDRANGRTGQGTVMQQGGAQPRFGQQPAVIDQGRVPNAMEQRRLQDGRSIVPEPQAEPPRTLDPRDLGAGSGPANEPGRRCVPTERPGVMRCPDAASLSDCEAAQRRGQVRQCLSR